MIPAHNQLVLGTATLGLEIGRDGAYRLLDAFVEMGGRLIDSAAVYSDWVPGEVGRSEAIVGEWLRRRSDPHAVAIYTKGAHPPLSDPGHSRLDRPSIERDVEDSLRRLGVEQIALYYLHRDDPARPVEEILETLARLVAAGKIAAIGVSNWQPERIAAARRTGILPIRSNQVLGNVLCRHMASPDDPSIVILDGPTYRDADDNDMSLLLFSSQCGGYLNKRAAAIAAPGGYDTPAGRAAAARIEQIAAGMDLEPTHLAVAFLLAYSPRFFPILGSRTIAQLENSMEAARIELDASTVAEVARVAGFDWR